MGWIGSANAAATSLKNNRRRYQHGFDKRGGKFSENYIINYRSLDEEELEMVRTKIAARKRRRTLKDALVIVLILVVIIALASFILQTWLGEF